MRKLWYVLFIMAFIGFAAAQEEEENDEGIGLTAGLELGLGNVVDEVVFSTTPYIVYEKSFGPIDVFGELDYTATFDDPLAHDLYFEVELGYNLQLAEPSVLSFMVNNNNTFFLYPELEEGFTHEGVVTPMIKYTHTLSFGDLYAQVGVPIWYLTGVKDETAIDLEPTVGWASTFGLGLEFTGYTTLHPDTDFAGYGLLASYENGIFYGELEFIASKEFKDFELYPEVDISVGSWTFTARMELYKYDGIDDWVVCPFIGVSYSF